MTIDFSLSPELEEIRARTRTFVEDVIKPTEQKIHDEKLAETDRKAYLGALLGMRKQAREAGIWLPHMPAEWGGMGLGHVQLAMVQAEAAKSSYGPWVFNCQAPDEGNMHTLLHWGTDEQKETYLRPLCEGTAWSCFAMTEPEVAGSDPTLIQTRATRTARSGCSTGTSGSSPTPTGRTSPSSSPAPRTIPTCRRRPTRRSSSNCPPRGGGRCARSRRCTAAPATPRS
jgi:alkylation response protein AidB-like acyl-CoA dehydrogenase